MYTIYVDGGSNNATIGEISIIILDDKNNVINKYYTRYNAKLTNNMMEYKAVTKASIWIRDNMSKFYKLRVFSDSLLVVNQVKGLWKINEEHLKKSSKTVNSFLTFFNKRYQRVVINWIHRDKNLAGIELEKIQKQRKAFKNKRIIHRRGWYVGDIQWAHRPTGDRC